MTLDELLDLEPTMSEYTSEKLILEIMHKEEWRCYPSSKCEQSEQLAQRYLKYHATMPGLLSKEVYATMPSAVFYATGGESYVRGGLFVNGAVLSAQDPGKPRAVSLFIDEASAQRFRYPDDEFVYLSDIHGEDVT